MNNTITENNILDNLGIYFISINDKGRCELTMSELKKIILRAYEAGVVSSVAPLNSLINDLNSDGTGSIGRPRDFYYTNECKA